MRLWLCKSFVDILWLGKSFVGKFLCFRAYPKASKERQDPTQVINLSMCERRILMVRNVSIFRSQDRTSHHRRDRRTHVCRTQSSTRIHRALEVRHLQSQRPFEMGARQRDKHRSARSSEERLTLLHQQLCAQNNLYRKISIVCVCLYCV